MKWRTAVIVITLLCFVPGSLLSRIQLPEGAIDLTRFVSSAPVILRGVVAEVAVTDTGSQFARLQVDRWYRGEGAPSLVRYRTGFGMPGHDCINFKPGTYWLIFAQDGGGHLELLDDCYGAVAISSQIAPASPHPEIVPQIEADLIAGLADTDPAGRLVSIQRLGGLKSASSRPALHSVIESGDALEKDWATYAAVRTGDTTVFPRMREMFARKQKDTPTWFLHYLSWEMGKVSDRSVVPDLIDIAKGAAFPGARQEALTSLGHNFHATEALPTIAAGLADSDPGVRFAALSAMQEITHQPACTRSMDQSQKGGVEPKAKECLAWWKNRRR